MKAEASPHGSGPRGRLIVAAATVVMLILALVMGGCGSSSADNSTTGSQLDEAPAGATTIGSGEGVGTSGNTGGTSTAGNQPVLAGYTENQCVTDLTARYGSSETAQQVCGTIRTDYGASTQSSVLPTVVPAIESKLNVKPVPDAPPVKPPVPPAGGGNNTGGWDSGGIEIQVPPGP